MATLQDVVFQCEKCEGIFGKMDEFCSHKCEGKKHTDTKDYQTMYTEGAPVGPLSELVPKRFHKHISKELLKSYLADNERDSDTFKKKADPADIPVIVKKKTTHVYPHILKHLTEDGEHIVKSIVSPWVINTLIDWANWDLIMCSKPLKDSDNDSESTQDSSPATPVSPEHNEVSASNACHAKPNVNESSAPTMLISKRLSWTKEAVLKLIELHNENDRLFNKSGIKKKSIWENIALKISELGETFSGPQCEQKWKNITKQYRDVVDHNNTSGNDRKECPFFNELNSAYGYRPNVKPVYIQGSLEKDRNNNDEINSDSSESTSGQGYKRKADKEVEVKKTKKSTSTGDNVMDFLKDMQKNLQEGQKAVLEQLKSQHEQKMKNEEAKLDLLGKLVNKISEQK